MTVTTITMDSIAEARVDEIRQLLADADQRLAEAIDGERVAFEAVDAAKARKALEGATPDTRSELQRAQNRLATASEEREGLASLRKRLAAGLERASSRDAGIAHRKWQARAAEERRRVDDDRAQTVRVLDQVVATLEAEEQRLQGRRRAVDQLVTEAAGEGAGLTVHAARPLTQDHKAFRGVLETIQYLRAVRTQQ